MSRRRRLVPRAPTRPYCILYLLYLQETSCKMPIFSLDPSSHASDPLPQRVAGDCPLTRRSCRAHGQSSFSSIAPRLRFQAQPGRTLTRDGGLQTRKSSLTWRQEPCPDPRTDSTRTSCVYALETFEATVDTLALLRYQANNPPILLSPIALQGSSSHSH